MTCTHAAARGDGDLDGVPAAGDDLLEVEGPVAVLRLVRVDVSHLAGEEAGGLGGHPLDAQGDRVHAHLK